MTIALAVKNKFGTYIGSDSRLTSGTSIVAENCPKWLKLSGWYLGFSGMYRSSVLLRNQLKPKNSDNPDDIAANIKSILDQDGYFGTADIGPKIGPDNFILVSTQTGNIFEIGTDFSSHEIAKYTAIGSGAEFAMGALFAQKKVSEDGSFLSTSSAIRIALLAAYEFDCNCGGKLYIKKAH